MCLYVFELFAALTIDTIFAALRTHVGEAAFSTTETYFWIQIVDLARTIVARDGNAGGAQPGRLAWSAFRYTLQICMWKLSLQATERDLS